MCIGKKDSIKSEWNLIHSVWDVIHNEWNLIHFPVYLLARHVTARCRKVAFRYERYKWHDRQKIINQQFLSHNITARSVFRYERQMACRTMQQAVQARHGWPWSFIIAVCFFLWNLFHFCDVSKTVSEAFGSLPGPLAAGLAISKCSRELCLF